MTTEKRDIFAARLRHELTQETHVVVGDHDPERKRWRDRPIYRHTLAQDMAQRRPGAFHDMELKADYVVRHGTMSEHEYKTGPIPREIADRQLDLYSFALTGGPTLPRVSCKCHERMGNDFYFLPCGSCLYDINECTDPLRSPKP